MKRNPSERVPGEDVGRLVPTVLLLVGIVCAAGSVELFSATSNAAEVRPPGLKPAEEPALQIRVANSAARAPSSIASAEPTRASAGADSRNANIECAALVIPFAVGSREPTAEGSTNVSTAATWLIAHPDAHALVHGHADAMGDEDANLKLSKDRAQKITQLLIQHGVEKARLTSRGFGSYQPVEGVTEDAAINRRVNIFVRGTKDCPDVSDKEKSP